MKAGSKTKSTRGMTSVFAVVMLAGAALPLGNLAGCREDPAALQAVKKASHSINTVAGGAEAAVSIDRQETAFKQALSELGAAKVDASNPLSSATGVLTAASQLGSAGTASEAAQASLTALSGLRSELRSAMLQWSSVNAIAESAKYDPAPRLAEIDAALTAARGEQQQAQERLSAVVREQDTLLASAKEKAEQAAKFEQESVKLREESRRMKASESQSVLTRALEAKRQCDELRLELARIEADATLLEPKKLGLNQRLQELDIGIKSVEAERVRVQRRGEEASSVVTQAGAQVATTAGTVDGFAKRISEEREKVLVPALDEVIETCKKSASAATAAKGPTVAAVARLRLGEVLLLKAGEAREHAALMTDLAAIKPALAGQASFAEAAKAAQESVKSATEEAKEAFEAARSAYKGLRVKAEADEATKAAVIAYLTQIGGLTPDDAETPPAAEGTLAAEGNGPEKGPDAPSDAAAGEADVRALFADIVKAIEAGDPAALASKVHVEGVSAQTLAPAMELLTAGSKLDAACRSKFNTSLDEGMKAAGMGGDSDESEGSLPVTAAELESAKYEVTGDTAVFTPETGKPLNAKKIDGEWKVDLSSKLKPEMIDQMAMMGGTMSKAMNETAAEVAADKYATIEEAVKAMIAKLTGAPAGGGKGGSGAGGGG